MAKKYKSQKPKAATERAKPAAAPEPVVAALPPAKPWSIFDFKLQAIIVGLLAFVFYINTSSNEFAHDDGIVIIKNKYVEEGVSGIPDIFKKDAYDSYYHLLKTENQLQGGRYRPLSLVTFAIEQQLFGPLPPDRVDSVLDEYVNIGLRGDQEKKVIHQMHIRHVVNVLWYVAACVVLLYFLRYIVFRSSPVAALVAAVIFTIHPIHTEVVANVKSRDEIMSLLFICLTFIMEFKYREKKNPWLLVAALLSYFCAILSKEYAITLVALLPLSLIVFNRYTLQKSIMAFLPYVGVIVVYMALRTQTYTGIVANAQNEVLNNPYLFATKLEKLATEIATSLNYLKLLIFPHPLSADYSYDSIPYKDFGHPLVWLSLAVHITMAWLMVRFFFSFLRRRPDVQVAGLKQGTPPRMEMEGIMCFAIAFYLLHLLLVCNIFFDIGATMGERLIYHSSMGFAIAAGWLLVKGFEKIKPVTKGHMALAGCMAVIVVLCGFKTITRNADWKNDGVLFRADLKTVPNSVLVCANVAAAYIHEVDDTTIAEPKKKEMLTDAIKLLDHALSIHPDMVASYMNRGIAYYKLGQMDKAKADLDAVRKRYPTYPTLKNVYRLVVEDYLKKGWDVYGAKGMYPEAIAEFRKGIAIDSTDPRLWYNLGGAYFSNHQYGEAIQAWQVNLKLDPKNRSTMQGMRVAMHLLDSMNHVK